MKYSSDPESPYLFSCSEEGKYSCNNIQLEVDHKTGNSKIKFNQTKIYDIKNVLTLSGTISGQLQQDPSIVNIPASGRYDFTYQLSDNNQIIPIENSNFTQFHFTNHNIQEFTTSPLPSKGFLYVKAVNNIVDEVSFFSILLEGYGYAFWDRESKTNIQNISYNPINLTVTLNQFKFSSDGYPDLYLNGMTGP
ncbi:hypothetical protein [Acinetobacter chinensis]|uniref:hypothetical protein n=1 Tax=Acinetobacter chinensis TaxID=2004650 RepID=UPI001D0DAAE0|nr:hypothetical protein [Acinetobacter chinensis]